MQDIDSVKHKAAIKAIYADCHRVVTIHSHDDKHRGTALLWLHNSLQEALKGVEPTYDMCRGCATKELGDEAGG